MRMHHAAERIMLHARCARWALGSAALVQWQLPQPAAYSCEPKTETAPGWLWLSRGERQNRDSRSLAPAASDLHLAPARCGSFPGLAPGQAWLSALREPNPRRSVWGSNRWARNARRAMHTRRPGRACLRIIDSSSDGAIAGGRMHTARKAHVLRAASAQIGSDQNALRPFWIRTAPPCMGDIGAGDGADGRQSDVGAVQRHPDRAVGLGRQTEGHRCQHERHARCGAESLQIAAPAHLRPPLQRAAAAL